MHRALLASLTLHAGLLAVLLMQQGSVPLPPAAQTIQLLPPGAVATGSARQVPAAAKPARQHDAAPPGTAPAVSTPVRLQPVPAAVSPLPPALPAATGRPEQAAGDGSTAPAAAVANAAQGGSVAMNNEGRGRSQPVQVPADRPAKAVQMPAPDYPPLSREQGEQGVVLLQLSVDASGRLGEVSMVRSSGFSRLDKAARAVVQRWRFQPAIENGQPVSAQLTLPVRFALDEN